MLVRETVPTIFLYFVVPSEVSGLSASSISSNEVTISWSSAPGDADDYDLFLNPKDLVEGSPSPRSIKGNSYTFKGNFVFTRKILTVK